MEIEIEMTTENTTIKVTGKLWDRIKTMKNILLEKPIIIIVNKLDITAEG